MTEIKYCIHGKQCTIDELSRVIIYFVNQFRIDDAPKIDWVPDTDIKLFMAGYHVRMYSSRPLEPIREVVHNANMDTYFRAGQIAACVGLHSYRDYRRLYYD